MRPFTALLACLVFVVRLHAATIDTLCFGESESEEAHGLVAEPQASDTVAGLLGERARRLLPGEGEDWRGGSMRFTLKVEPDAQSYLTLRLSGDDVSPTRLFLVVEGRMVGYLHLGDIDLLEPGTSEPQFPGRFLYRTTPLPENITAGRTHVRCEIRSAGPIWAYGQTLEKFQKPMIVPSRGLYRAYVHRETAFVPPPDETQGAAPPDKISTTTGPEALQEVRDRVNNEITARLKDRRPLNQMQMMFLAEAWHVSWTAAYKNEDVIRRIVDSMDAFGLAWRTNPKLGTEDPSTSNPGWFGTGPLGATLHWLAQPLRVHLDERVNGAADSITRRVLLAGVLSASREWNARNRRLYTNQTMIKDLYGIYYANRGLAVVAPTQAWPEEKALRYLYEAVGLQPWLGSDLPEGGSAESAGDSYYQLTAKGLTKELGYVGSYGEVVDWVTKIYDATRPAPGEPGDARLLARLVEIARARAPFRYPMADEAGARAMRMETAIGWRDNKYPGAVVYGQKPARDATALDAAYATRDPYLVGYAQQMIADNQFFDSLRTVMAENGSLRITAGLLQAPDAYRFISSLPASPHRLPMSAGSPDTVFTDEENGVVALKHGDEILYASLYWRARNAINFLASVHHLTPSIERQAIVRVDVRFTPSGDVYRRPQTVVLGFGNGGSNLKYPPGSLPLSAHAGEELPIARVPADVPFRPGQESVFAGKGDLYVLRYGAYFIAMNLTSNRPQELEVPADFAGASDLTVPSSPRAVAGKRMLAPRTTVILRKID